MLYRVQVTETTNHVFIVEAEDEATARDVYQNMSGVYRRLATMDGAPSWDSMPWEIEEASAADWDEQQQILKHRRPHSDLHLNDMSVEQLAEITCEYCGWSGQTLDVYGCRTAIKNNERECCECCARAGGCCA